MFRFTLLLAVLLLAGASTAQASLFHCDGGTCAVEVAPGITLEVGAEDVNELEDRPGFHLTGDIILRTDFHDFHLLASDLVLEPRDSGPLPFELYGAAGAPLTDIPVLGDFLQINPIAAVGLVSRETLKELLESDGAAPLPLAENPRADDPDTLQDPAYFFFHVATGLELDLHLAELLGLNTEEGAHDPFQYSVPGDTSLTVILDPTDPYFYLSSDARSLATEKLEAAQEKAELYQQAWEEQEEERKRQEAEEARDQEGNGTGQESGNDPGQDTGDDRSNDQDNRNDDGKADDSGNGPELGAIAFSWQGGIPFVPETTWGLPEDAGEFYGNVYLEAEIPLPYKMVVDGSLVSYIGEEGFEIGANGDLLVSFDLLPFFGIELPLGSASGGVRIREDGFATYFSGELSPDVSFLPPEIPITPSNELRVAGYLDTRDIAASSLRAEGLYSLGVGELGDLIGVDLSEALVIAGELSIDKTGFWLRGSTTSKIGGGIDFGGEVVVEAFFSAENFRDSYVLLEGNLAVGGIQLGAGASARLSAAGFFINGYFQTPVSSVDLAGSITADGPSLEGFAQIAFSLEGLNAEFDKALVALDKAQDSLDAVTGEIERVRKIVAGDRERDQQALQSAQGAVTGAQREVDKLQSSINANHKHIRTRKSQIASWKRWYKKLAWYKKSWGWAKLGAEIAWRSADIGRRYATIAGLEAAKGIARGTLELAKLTLRGLEETSKVFPIDADPRVAALFVVRDGAWLAIEAAELVLDGFPRIDGNAVDASITLYVGPAGIQGDVQASVAGLDLVHGWVDLSRDPEACIEIAVLGTACAPF